MPIDNIVGYASDTTNVMFGQHHSVVSFLKERLSHLFVIKCLCHSAHLCASHACEKLPRSIETLIRDIYSHFSHSAKRIAQYKTFQRFTDTEPHKILKPSQTRWLSLEACVRRVLEQWAALEAYFESTAENDRLVSSQNIFSALKNPIFKLYLSFLKFVLPKFTHFNKLFQSEKPNLHILDKCLVTIYKAFLSCYMSTAYLSKPIESIDPTSTAHMLPLTSMAMGQDVSDFLVKTDIVRIMKREVLGFFEHVRLFFVEAASQIKARFPINDPIIKSLRLVNPECIQETKVADVIQIASKFPNILSENDLLKLDDEWRELQFTDTVDIPEYSGHRDNVATFWGNLGKIEDACGSLKFPIIGKLTKSLLSIPHSNADVEWIFSHVNLIKVKQRNKLKVSTLDALLMVKQGSSSNSWVDFNPTPEMCDSINTTMYLSDSDSD